MQYSGGNRNRNAIHAGKKKEKTNYTDKVNPATSFLRKKIKYQQKY